MDPYTAHIVIRDATFIAFAAIVGIGFPVARAYGRRIEKSGPATHDAMSAEGSAARLERVERAVEAMALEVERMAEGQRFMTRLLAEPGRTRAGPDAGPPILPRS